MSTFYRLFYFVISTFFPIHLFFYKEQVYKQLPLYPTLRAQPSFTKQQ